MGQPHGIAPAAPGQGGRGLSLGGEHIAAGLGRLGQGIEQAAEGFAAKRDQQAAYTAAADAAAGKAAPLSSHGGGLKPPPLGGSPSAGASPYGGLNSNTPDNPAFSPIGAGGNVPVFAQPGAGGGIAGTSVGSAGNLPIMAQNGGTAGPDAAQNGGGIKAQIARYIVDYSIKRGVDPNLMLGIAAREGLDRQNPLATNPDGAGNTAIGPFQFGTRYLGGELGITAETAWQKQVEAAVDYAATHSQAQVTSQWHSIPDNGGWGAITGIGKNYASKLGISPGGGTPAVSIPPESTPVADINPAQPVPVAAGAPQTGPAYSDDTWNNRPQFDYGGGGRQSMNELPIDQRQLLAALLAGQNSDAAA